MLTLNQEKKRLEPTETLCQFCETVHSEDMEDNCFIPLYREKDRTNIVVYRSVKYSKIPVGIPRCKECKAIHEQATTKGALIAWGASIVFVIIVFMISLPLGYFSIFAGIMIGAFGSRGLYRKFVRDKLIYNEREGAEHNPAIRELLLNGWTLNQPLA